MPREKHWPRCVRSKREVIRFSAGFWDCRSRDNLGVGGRGPSSGSPASMIESPCCLQPRAPCALINEPAMARRRSQRPAAAAAAAAAHASAHLAPLRTPLVSLQTRLHLPQNGDKDLPGDRCFTWRGRRALQAAGGPTQRAHCGGCPAPGAGG